MLLPASAWQNIFHRCIDQLLIMQFDNKKLINASIKIILGKFLLLGNKGEDQDNAITEMVHNQIHTSPFKHF